MKLSISLYVIPHSGPLRTALIERLSCNRPPAVATILFLDRGLYNCHVLRGEGRRKPLNTPYHNIPRIWSGGGKVKLAK